MAQIEILVIGTEPPCPRCALITKNISDIIKTHKDVSITHIGFDSQQAKDFGSAKGYKIGTAKDISTVSGISIDWNLVSKTIEDKKGDNHSIYHTAEWWSPELDLLLKPCQDVAKKYGYLMTPVIVINGDIKHHGSVPGYEELRKLIFEDNAIM